MSQEFQEMPPKRKGAPDWTGVITQAQCGVASGVTVDRAYSRL